jgi:hypothetical protein
VHQGKAESVAGDGIDELSLQDERAVSGKSYRQKPDAAGAFAFRGLSSGSYSILSIDLSHQFQVAYADALRAIIRKANGHVNLQSADGSFLSQQSISIFSRIRLNWMLLVLTCVVALVGCA